MWGLSMPKAMIAVNVNIKGPMRSNGPIHNYIQDPGTRNAPQTSHGSLIPMSLVHPQANSSMLVF